MAIRKIYVPRSRRQRLLRRLKTFRYFTNAYLRERDTYAFYREHFYLEAEVCNFNMKIDS